MVKNYSFGLLGFPLGHSLSPILHKTALYNAGLVGEYLLYPINPINSEQGLMDILLLMRQHQIHGLNVTIPYKQSIINYVDEVSVLVNKINAINTIYLKEKVLFGDNTDVRGFIIDLYRKFGGYINQTRKVKSFSTHLQALIIGAGGSACAVGFALLGEGWKVIIAARRLTEAVKIVKLLVGDEKNKDNVNETCVEGIELSEESFRRIIGGVDLIVNTTPVGMWPDIQTSVWPKNLKFPQQTMLYDLIYNPRETELMRIAKTQGAVVSNGLGMLIEQAALSFEIWTEKEASRKAMQLAVDKNDE